MSQKTILEETKTTSQNTHNIIEAAERKALLSLSMKEQIFDARRNELNLLEELRKYRRSDQMKPKSPSPFPKRKTKSI